MNLISQIWRWMRPKQPLESYYPQQKNAVPIVHVRLLIKIKSNNDIEIINLNTNQIVKCSKKIKTLINKLLFLMRYNEDTKRND